MSKDILLKSGDLQKWHNISDPQIVAQELVGFNAKIRDQRRNKDDDEKFVKAMSEKLSQPNELDNFKKLDELEALQYLADSYINIFRQDISFIEFLARLIIKPFR
jgi:hypothetical protein